MSTLLQLQVPLVVHLPRKTKEDKKIYLNLNTYRNLHHMSNNQAKVLFKGLLTEALGDLAPLQGQVRLTYTMYQQANRATDVANVLSIVDKFTCDALVELGILSDDNCRIVPEVVYRYGGVDKDNPRAELAISTYP